MVTTSAPPTLTPSADSNDAAGIARIDFDLKYGVAAKDYDGMVTRGELSPLKAALFKAHDAAKEVIETIDYLKARELRMKQTTGASRQVRANDSDSTEMRVFYFGLLSLVVVVAAAVAQAAHMRGHLRRLKVT